MGSRLGRDIPWVLLAGVVAGVAVAVLDLGSLGAAIVTSVVIGAVLFTLELRRRD